MRSAVAKHGRGRSNAEILMSCPGRDGHSRRPVRFLRSGICGGRADILVVSVRGRGGISLVDGVLMHT